MRSNQRGISIVEFALVMAVGSAVILSTLSGFNHWMHVKRVETGKNQVSLLKTALDQFYLSHCDDAAFPSVSVANLISESFLPSYFDASTQWGGSFTVSVQDSALPPTYTLSLVVAAAVDPIFIGSALLSDNVSGQTLSWRAIPSMKSGRTSQFKRYYGNGC